MQMATTSDETQIQIFANWPMSHSKRVARDNRKNPEYHVVAAIRKPRADTNCPAGNNEHQFVPYLMKRNSYSRLKTSINKIATGFTCHSKMAERKK